ncbi:voltage-dependent anion channel [Coemansia mojavensis]|nr:voltage-dependent anion channel [Coemansia mojavensis]
MDTQTSTRSGASFHLSFMRDLQEWRHIIKWFMPSWFTVCMGSGILASCIGRLPYESQFLQILGYSIFFLNIALLFTFLALQTVQLVLFPEIISFMRHNPKRMLHYGAIPMALATVVSGMCNFGFAQQSFTLVCIAWTVWWASVILASAASVLLICLVVSRETQSIESCTAAWLLLVAPLSVCATAGGNIADLLPARLSLITLVVSYTLLGAGAPLTCCLLVLYMFRITAYKLPSHDSIITAFIPLGPIGQIGAAALSLGSIANQTLIAALPHLDSIGTTLLHFGILVALLSWGSCIFWLTHAIFSVIYQRRFATIPFNMSWWSLTFPFGVFATLTSYLGDVLQMWYLQVNFMIVVALLLVFWLFNMVRTVASTWTGSVFAPPSVSCHSSIKDVSTMNSHPSVCSP